MVIKITYLEILSVLYYIIFTVFFFLLAVIMFIIAIRTRNIKNHYAGGSTIASGVLLFLIGLHNLLFGFFPHPLYGFIIWWIVIIFLINSIFSLTIRKELKKMQLESQIQNVNLLEDHKKSTLRKFIELMTRNNSHHESISLKMEAIRKSFHLFGILILVSFFGFIFIPPLTYIVNYNVVVFIEDTKWLYRILWGDPNEYPYEKEDYNAVIDLTFFALICALFFAIIPDIIRVLWGPEYSMLNFLTKAILRKKEYDSIGPQIFLLIGVIFSYMLFIMKIVHVLVVFTGISIACFSDALAALIGRFYGKRKVKCIGGEIKSVEGFIAGTVSAFIIGCIFLGPIYGLIAALIFFLLDYFPTIIADNILNPILIIIGICIAIIILGFPIGWI